MSRLHLQEFDPFDWFEKMLSPQCIHRLIRVGVIAILVLFLAHRISQYRSSLVKPLWVAETLLFAVFVISYIIRIDPVDRSRGAKEILVPLIGAVLPFALLLTPTNPWIAGDRMKLRIIFYWMTTFTSLTVWGLWTLKRSFSITVEARTLVTGGPYRWVRHPVYLGEILTYCAVLLWRYSIANTVIFSAFVLIQMLRAKWEEEKLGRVFPNYNTYAAKTWWFLPSRSKV